MIRTNDVIRDAIYEFPDLFILTVICAHGLDIHRQRWLVELLIIFWWLYLFLYLYNNKFCVSAELDSPQGKNRVKTQKI